MAPHSHDKEFEEISSRLRGSICEFIELANQHNRIVLALGTLVGAAHSLNVFFALEFERPYATEDEAERGFIGVLNELVDGSISPDPRWLSGYTLNVARGTIASSAERILRLYLSKDRGGVFRSLCKSAEVEWIAVKTLWDRNNSLKHATGEARRSAGTGELAQEAVAAYGELIDFLCEPGVAERIVDNYGTAKKPKK